VLALKNLISLPTPTVVGMPAPVYTVILFPPVIGVGPVIFVIVAAANAYKPALLITYC